MCDRNIDQLLLASPQLGTWPITQACALTGNQTGNLSFHRPVLIPLRHTSQGRILFFCSNSLSKYQQNCQIFPFCKIHLLAPFTFLSLSINFNARLSSWSISSGSATRLVHVADSKMKHSLTSLSVHFQLQELRLDKQRKQGYPVYWATNICSYL